MSCYPLFFTKSNEDLSVQQQFTDFHTLMHHLVRDLGMRIQMTRVCFDQKTHQTPHLLGLAKLHHPWIDHATLAPYFPELENQHNLIYRYQA